MSSLTPRLDRLDKNYIINSEMLVAQRGTTFTGVTNAYTLDRWKFNKNSVATYNVEQSTDVPTIVQAGLQLSNSLRIVLTAADNSIANNDYSVIQYLMEGYDWKQLHGKDLTLAFWIKVNGAAVGPGTYSIGLTNGAGSLSYVASYTIDVLNTWEKKVIHIPANVTGSWNFTNGTGMVLHFTLMAGTDYHGTPGTWQSGNKFAVSSQFNGAQAGVIDHKLTGVSLRVGTNSDPEFTTYGEDFNNELVACQRYYEKTYPLNRAPGTAGTDGDGCLSARLNPGGASNNDFITLWRFNTAKRTTPTMTWYNPVTGTTGEWKNDVPGTLGAMTIASGTNEFGSGVTNVTPSNTAFHRVHGTADAEL